MHFIHFLTCCIFLMAVCMHLAKCQTCGPRVSPRLLREIPCDLNAVPYCTLPGSAYPWSSLRRYIYENQGFVKRMYGEQRQSQLVHEEMTRLNEYYDVEWREARVMTSNNTSTSGESVTGLPLDSQSKGETVDNATMTPLSNYINDEMVSLSTTDANLNDSGDNVESTTTTSAINHESGSNTVPLETRATSVPTPKGFNACPITQEVVAPYWANNTRGETLALLNVYPFEQYIHWEKCAFEGEQMYCREGCRCEQQYRLHRLLAFDPKNECRGIFADWFRFPGCCVCICYDNQARINNRKSRL